jgi:predicted enzyme related to lactoylglutathione lyase
LTRPATTEHRPGKFIWADLFTADPVAATKFYTSVFGWTVNLTTQNSQVYIVLSNLGNPVAGLVARPPASAKRPSRWIGYIAVTDLPATLALVTGNGGLVRAEPRAFPDRGVQAIIADNEGAAIGLLQSTSGDPADTEPKPGDWQWFELFAKQPQATADFYRKVVAYEVAPDLRSDRKNDFFLTRGGQARAGVAPIPEDLTDAKADWLGVVRVAGMDATLAQVTKLGGEILVPAHAAALGSRFAIIADPTGGAIGLVEYVNNANPADHP